MKEANEHLDIDLEFLGKKEAVVMPPKAPRGTAPNLPSTGRDTNWKKILLIGGGVLFFSWALFSEDSTSSTDSPSGNIEPASGNLIVGEYSCSSYHYDQAVKLDPDETEELVDMAVADLETRALNIERVKNEIEYSPTSEYSPQWAIDEFNQMVDDYNLKVQLYQRDSADVNARVDRYNQQIEAHNNYLVANCTKT